MGEIIVDVREKDEFDAEHIPASVNIPLSSFSSQAPGILGSLKQKNILLVCRSGNRARLAQNIISQIGFVEDVKSQILEGGLLQWKKNNGALIASKKAPLPLMRQVQIGAGSLVLFSVLGSFFIHKNLFWLAGFVGAGLIFAGLTGFCGMAILLQKMPWNQTKQG